MNRVLKLLGLTTLIVAAGNLWIWKFGGHDPKSLFFGVVAIIASATFLICAERWH